MFGKVSWNPFLGMILEYTLRWLLFQMSANVTIRTLGYTHGVDMMHVREPTVFSDASTPHLAVMTACTVEFATARSVRTAS